jgi:aryl-alcohol dehydrogenase-like predicted oxidoreductase
MNRRTLGRTGLRVSELGLGVCFVAAKGQRVVTEGVRAGIDAGIDYFDTAPYYTAGMDEEMLGNALDGVRHRVTLATKVGYTEEPDDHRSVEGLMRQLDGSLARLRTDWVDVVQIHEADFRKWWVDQRVARDEGMSPTAPLIRDDESYDFASAPVVEFLQRARQAGKARFVGITAKDARLAARVVDALDVDTVMVAHQFNPVMRNAAEFLFPGTDARDIGVLVGAPLMKGWLAAPREKWRDVPPPWMDEPFRRAYFGCVAVAARSGIDLAQLTIRWMLGEMRQHSLVFGFRSTEEIAANVRAAVAGSLPASLRAEIDALGIVHPLIFQGRTTL